MNDEMKVFGVGLQKTGTTTLKYALELLGYKVSGPNWKLLREVQKGNYNNISSLVFKYDAFQDEPWPHVYKYLDHHYSNSKFILTIRDEEKWIESISNFMSGRNLSHLEWVFGNSEPVGNENLYIKAFNDHNLAVKDYFKNDPSKFLIIDWEKEKDMARLAEFLEVTTPKTYITKKPLAVPQVLKGQYSQLAKIKKEVKKNLIHVSKKVSPKIYFQFYRNFKKWFLFNIKWRI